jgi:hypothetical protein
MAKKVPHVTWLAVPGLHHTVPSLHRVLIAAASTDGYNAAPPQEARQATGSTIAMLTPFIDSRTAQKNSVLTCQGGKHIRCRSWMSWQHEAQLLITGAIANLPTGARTSHWMLRFVQHDRSHQFTAAAPAAK